MNVTRPALRIPLTRGYFAIVDAKDYERIAAVKWYAVKEGNTVYARRTIRLSKNKDNNASDAQSNRRNSRSADIRGP